MLDFKSYRTARVTLPGIELAHRIRKRHSSSGRPMDLLVAKKAVKKSPGLNSAVAFIQVERAISLQRTRSLPSCAMGKRVFSRSKASPRCGTACTAPLGESRRSAAACD